MVILFGITRLKKVVPSRQIPYMYVKLDSVKSGGTVSVYLYGKKTLNSPLYGIGDTITWKMTTADTSFCDIWVCIQFSRLYTT